MELSGRSSVGIRMQIEGFWYYLFSGVFEAATIHYVVAKIFGLLFFGRGWCGYACWTAMMLDLLPYKQPIEPRKKFGYIRYITFGISLLFVATLFLLHIPKESLSDECGCNKQFKKERKCDGMHFMLCVKCVEACPKNALKL